MLHAHSQSVSCITSSSTSTETHSAEELARQIGALAGITVRGGFIFGADGERLGRGWRGYAAALEADGKIVRDGDGYRLGAELEMAVAPPARSIIEAPRTVAAREARRPEADEGAVARCGTRAKAKAGTVLERRARLVPLILALLEEKRRTTFLADDEIAETIDEDPDDVSDAVSDLLNGGRVNAVIIEGEYRFGLGCPEDAARRVLMEAALGREIGPDEDLETIAATWALDTAPRFVKLMQQPPGAMRLVIDPAAANLARYTYREARRRKLIPKGYTFESWASDAIYERAALLRQEALDSNGHGDRFNFNIKPDFRPIGAGLQDGDHVRGFYLEW